TQKAGGLTSLPRPNEKMITRSNICRGDPARHGPGRRGRRAIEPGCNSPGADG
ncbi:MAG: hypothetical protein H6Q05_3540, partial [Acidobacteria bacterium]|nr:hypothetical protein [Acidobacteriota bacterium]